MTGTSFKTRNFWVLPTATTIALGSFLAGQPSLVPSENYEFAPRHSIPYSWEQEFTNPYYEILEAERKILYKAEIIYQFASKLISESQDLDPVFAKSINDSFWDLV